MAIFSFTLSEEGVGVFHDALACITKFSEDVCLEARKDKLTLTALNLSKSAYICFTFAANRFFSRFAFEGSEQNRERFFCQLYIRALITVFWARQGGDSSRDKDNGMTIERCDVTIDDGPGTKSRFIAKIIYRNGIAATHALPFEVKAPTHAKFVKEEAVHHWRISSRTLYQLMDHFGPGIELLDINTDEDNRIVNFTCFTDKVARTSTNNEEVLKKPLHTSIAVEMDEFDELDVEDKLHIIISVKDFRAILQHAQLTSGELSSRYSNPGRPMKLAYAGDGVLCDFILMTVGQKDANAQRTKGSQAKRARSARPGLESASHRDSPAASENPAPSNDDPAPSEPPRTQAQAQRAAVIPRVRPSQFEIRPEPMPPPATMKSDSLFVTQNLDDDRQWEPVNPDQEEEEPEEDNTRLEWGGSNDNGQAEPSTMRISGHIVTQPQPGQDNDESADPFPAGLEPTQRLSQVRKFGLFGS